MPYNYFCCRHHRPLPVKYAAMQPPGLPNSYASPNCPACGKTMERYDTGTSPQDNRPVPPPRPDASPAPKISKAEVEIYSGSGMNPGHDLVTWKISRNASKMDMTVLLQLGQLQGGNYSSVQSFKMADGLLDTAQAGNKQDWWLKSPMTKAIDKEVWYEIDLSRLLSAENQGTLPAKLQIGVKLGNAAFGMIHLLAGHAKAVRNVGTHKVFSTGDPRDDIYKTLLSLQSGMERFKTESIKEIYYDAAGDKLLINGTNNGRIVVARRPGSPRFAITTIYNTSGPAFGNKIYP